ncbi:hypothetical protein IW261DRAFT_1430389 [Armillaria novae-zelandiae]|uniref:Uncharacterized protein n=1 Tax=Armillaria novae-zelandiae TaxID=153914 RepID=A0AA39KCM9_9AGAR|nr:hypothetical protein IW261DRAFT_1430389 [Armillaria novae-zelandiae]
MFEFPPRLNTGTLAQLMVNNSTNNPLTSAVKASPAFANGFASLNPLFCRVSSIFVLFPREIGHGAFQISLQPKQASSRRNGNGDNLKINKTLAKSPLLRSPPIRTRDCRGNGTSNSSNTALQSNLLPLKRKPDRILTSTCQILEAMSRVVLKQRDFSFEHPAPRFLPFFPLPLLSFSFLLSIARLPSDTLTNAVKVGNCQHPGRRAVVLVDSVTNVTAAASSNHDLQAMVFIIDKTWYATSTFVQLDPRYGLDPTTEDDGIGDDETGRVQGSSLRIHERGASSCAYACPMSPLVETVPGSLTAEGNVTMRIRCMVVGGWGLRKK